MMLQDYSSLVRASTSSVARPLVSRFSETLNLLDFITPEMGVDKTDAFNRMWVALKNSLSADAIDTVSQTIIIPPGVYHVDGSINFTGGSSSTFIGWNTHVSARGAVIVGHCAGKAVVDATGSRGMHMDGLRIVGDVANPPSTGLLLGPRANDTYGNNRFTDVQTDGYFTKAGVANLSGETTQFLGCVFANRYAGADVYGYIGDGCNRFGLTSDFATIRAAGTATSFTCNAFHRCDFRNYATGPAAYLEAAGGFYSSNDCYWLAFTGAALRIRVGDTIRSYSLDIGGSFETNQSPGLDYFIEFLAPAGGANDIAGFKARAFGSSQAKTAFFKMTDPGGGTPGSLVLRNAEIESSVALSTSTPMFQDCGTLSVIGTIKCKRATNLNLGNLQKMNGTIYTDNVANIASAPPSGSTVMVIDEQ